MADERFFPFALSLYESILCLRRLSDGIPPWSVSSPIVSRKEGEREAAWLLYALAAPLCCSESRPVGPCVRSASCRSLCVKIFLPIGAGGLGVAVLPKWQVSSERRMVCDRWHAQHALWLSPCGQDLRVALSPLISALALMYEHTSHRDAEDEVGGGE